MVPFNLWFTGLPLSGKTTIANSVYEELLKLNIPLERLDSKELRDVIPDIGYTREERIKHIYGIGHLIYLLQKHGVSTVASFVSPYREARRAVRDMVSNNIIIYIKADIQTCQKRDYKGVYQKALNGEIQNFTGVNDIYEEPQYADIIIDTDELSVEEATQKIITFVKEKYIK